MEELDFGNMLFYSVLFSLAIHFLAFQLRKHSPKATAVETVALKTVRCNVEYDPNDPEHKVVYIFDRQTDCFLTQASNIKEAVRNLVRQGYEVITFHPNHCPPEIFEQTKNITTNDFTRAL